jgi:hypothetical protein
VGGEPSLLITVTSGSGWRDSSRNGEVEGIEWLRRVGR